MANASHKQSLAVSCYIYDCIVALFVSTEMLIKIHKPFEAFHPNWGNWIRPKAMSRDTISGRRAAPHKTLWPFYIRSNRAHRPQHGGSGWIIFCKKFEVTFIRCRRYFYVLRAAKFLCKNENLCRSSVKAAARTCLVMSFVIEPDLHSCLLRKRVWVVIFLPLRMLHPIQAGD